MLRISPSLCGGSSAAEDEVFLISAVLNDIGLEVDEHFVIRRLVTIVRPNDCAQWCRASGLRLLTESRIRHPLKHVGSAIELFIIVKSCIHESKHAEQVER